MTERSFPGYGVLDKRDTPSWNDATRRAIDKRLAVFREPRFFTAAEFATLDAILAPHALLGLMPIGGGREGTETSGRVDACPDIRSPRIMARASPIGAER